MELGKYSIELLFLEAIKSEREAYELYSSLRKNSDKLATTELLGTMIEEEKEHEERLTALYDQIFPKREINPPENTSIPLPDIDPHEIGTPEELYEEIIGTEKKAAKYYEEFSKKFDDGSVMDTTLKDLSEMEEEHYKKFKDKLAELENIDELFDRIIS